MAAENHTWHGMKKPLAVFALICFLAMGLGRISISPAAAQSPGSLLESGLLGPVQVVRSETK
jgi:hypothetical protein